MKTKVVGGTGGEGQDVKMPVDLSTVVINPSLKGRPSYIF